MASRQPLVAFVALAVVLTACTGTATDTEPTAPPGVFAPTPTIGDPAAATTSTSTRPSPTTTIDLERAVIYPVDPLTLEALPGFEPISMGDWIWGQPSGNGNYFVAAVGNDNSGTAELRLISVVTWQPERSWRESPESELLVADNGTVYLTNLGRLHRLPAGDSESEVVAHLPSGFYSWGLGRLVDGAFLAFGSRFEIGGPTPTQHASIVSVAVTSGLVDEFMLPRARIGPVDPHSDDLWAGYMYATPSVVWDQARARALVVHGDEDVVSEIDLDSGSVTEHTFAGGAGTGDAPTANLQRSTALSPDGRYLNVSTRMIEGVGVVAQTWSVTSVPTGVISIDTTTWQVGSRVDEPIAEIHLSPTDDRILGWGFSTVEGDAYHRMESTGLFVLDSENLDVLAHHPPDRQDQSYGPFSFDDDDGGGICDVLGRPIKNRRH